MALVKNKVGYYDGSGIKAQCFTEAAENRKKTGKKGGKFPREIVSSVVFDMPSSGKSTRVAMKGNCAKCGGKVFKILKLEEIEELSKM